MNILWLLGEFVEYAHQANKVLMARMHSHFMYMRGYRNPFKHPHPEVVARYQELGSALYRTDSHGAVLLEFGDGRFTVVRQREMRRRYWLDSPVAGPTVDDFPVVW